MKLNRSGKLVLTALAALALLTLLGSILVTHEPGLPLAQRLFRAGYARADDHGAFLESYRANLWEHNGGYIPERTAEFLCARLSRGSSEEAGAIADFFVRQAGGREGMVIVRQSAALRQRVIGLVLGRLDRYTIFESNRALVLAEAMRRGENLGKASVGSEGETYGNWSKWWRKRGLPRARRAFEEWWRRPEPWESKARRDPLAGTGLSISAL